MTDAAGLAVIHASAFEAPWSAAEIEALLTGGAFALCEDDGFILVRVAADEAEILTLAVRPEARRGGLGRGLVDRAIGHAEERGARAMYLEVASDNEAAIGLYRAAGFKQAGLRPKYYRREGLQMQDALIFARALNTGG